MRNQWNHVLWKTRVPKLKSRLTRTLFPSLISSFSEGFWLNAEIWVENVFESIRDQDCVFYISLFFWFCESVVRLMRHNMRSKRRLSKNVHILTIESSSRNSCRWRHFCVLSRFALRGWKNLFLFHFAIACTLSLIKLFSWIWSPWKSHCTEVSQELTSWKGQLTHTCEIN